MSGAERGFVIDTNVIMGTFFYNSDHPQLREKRDILDKCRLVLSLLRERKIAVPRVAVVEAKRLSGDQKLAVRFGNAVENSFEVVGEEGLYSTAKDIASIVAPSRFDTHFITPAIEKGYSLITWDRPMCAHAHQLDVDCLLSVDESTSEEDIRMFMEV
jgi:hypothetical protein